MTVLTDAVSYRLGIAFPDVPTEHIEAAARGVANRVLYQLEENDGVGSGVLLTHHVGVGFQTGDEDMVAYGLEVTVLTADNPIDTVVSITVQHDLIVV